MTAITIPSAVDREKARADAQSGHASLTYQKTLRETVPAGTNIVVVAFTIDDLANLSTILSTMQGVAGVGMGKLVASGQAPSPAPIGVHGEGHWELSVDAGLRGFTAPAPAPVE